MPYISSLEQYFPTLSNNDVMMQKCSGKFPYISHIGNQGSNPHLDKFSKFSKVTKQHSLKLAISKITSKNHKSYRGTVGFQCQAIHKKFLRRFDTNFDIKMMMKIYAIEIIFKSHKPFQSYQLTGPANSAIKAGQARPVSW